MLLYTAAIKSAEKQDAEDISVDWAIFVHVLEIRKKRARL